MLASAWQAERRWWGQAHGWWGGGATTLVVFHGLLVTIALTVVPFFAITSASATVPGSVFLWLAELVVTAASHGNNDQVSFCPIGEISAFIKSV